MAEKQRQPSSLTTESTQINEHTKSGSTRSDDNSSRTRLVTADQHHSTKRTRSANPNDDSPINFDLIVHFGDGTTDVGSSSFQLPKSITLHDIVSEKSHEIKEGTLLSVLANGNDWELFKNSVTQVDTDDSTSALINCLSYDAVKKTMQIPVWRFPRRIDPIKSKPSGKSQNIATVSEAKVEHWYLPNFINTVFLIGVNGSGKSLLLSRFVEDAKEDVLLITSTLVIRKRDTDGRYYTQQHKAKRPPPEDEALLGKLTPKDQAHISDRFENIMKVWKLEFTNAELRGREVFFKRKASQNDQTIVGVYQYEAVSDGIRQIFHVILQYPYLKKYKVICLDEPESHLHPQLYCALVKDIITQLSDSSEFCNPSFRSATKLIIATHDFHLIDLLAKISEVHGVIMETRLQPVKCAPTTVDVFLKQRHAPGFLDQMHAKLYSIIETSCSSNAVFDRNRNQRSLISFSTALLQSMTDLAPTIVLCEGHSNNRSIDEHFYRLLFDPSKVEIRPAEGGCEEVRYKVKAAQKAQQLLSSPRIYIGICDRDRNFGIPKPDVVVLPVAEVENLFWHPELWKLYNEMLQVFEPTVQVNWIKEKKTEFWTRFRHLIKSRLYYYICEYGLEHHNSLHHRRSRKDTDRRPLKKCIKDNVDEIGRIMEQIRADILSERASFDAGWWSVIEDARKYSLAWKESLKSDQQTHIDIYKSKKPSITLDDNKTVIKCDEMLKDISCSESKTENIFPTKLFCALEQLSNVQNEDDEAFKEYYHLLNEKEVCNHLLQTVFALKKFEYVSNDPSRIMNIFTILMGKNNKYKLTTKAQQLRGVIRLRLLQIFKQLLTNAIFPKHPNDTHGSGSFTKKNINDALLID